MPFQNQLDDHGTLDDTADWVSTLLNFIATFGLVYWCVFIYRRTLYRMIIEEPSGSRTLATNRRRRPASGRSSFDSWRESRQRSRSPLVGLSGRTECHWPAHSCLGHPALACQRSPASPGSLERSVWPTLCSATSPVQSERPCWTRTCSGPGCRSVR